MPQGIEHVSQPSLTLMERITAGVSVGKTGLRRCWSCPPSKAFAEGREDDYPNTRELLFDAGGNARVNGIPFDDQRAAPRKEGWIEANINLGVHGVEAQ